MSLNSTRNSTHGGREKAEPSVHHVATDRVQQADIAPRPQAVNQVADPELENRIIDLLVVIQSRAGSVYDNGNASTIAILDIINAQQACLAQQLSAVSHESASGSVLVPSTGQNPSNEMNAIVLGFINERMWKRNFVSNNPPMAAGVWSGLVVEKIKNNYKYIYWTMNMTPAQATAKNYKVCSNSRRIEIHLRRLGVYNDNWPIIDCKIGYKQGNPDEKVYECLIEKDVMSDGELDSEVISPGYKQRTLQVAPPSWRSDEILNKLLSIIDKIMQTNDELQVTTMSKLQMIRRLTSIKNTPVSRNMSAIISEWAIQISLQLQQEGESDVQAICSGNQVQKMQDPKFPHLQVVYLLLAKPCITLHTQKYAGYFGGFRDVELKRVD
ncbi:hypothetical protein PHYBLDRAFT_152758 [Phycomyces blakesleeanus NRRL 1555(-)]|uniref:Uncharacterized protein n=1 Tax=Phycomyces blakesleeanus (strain ATCC 8743b / DSM 1359 / FGSC 10004 / NBRC 33097 / NRRL 1555) TaxID=763407 RepID=A0A162ZE67_PHYB8|nr:hypothetical protein PHYBLDRAFT_152758 [Phycomyces blakesleeanus NRRL 1555(-)]OAD66191.1 hypothetical protein PHYBLDRAFT_152758 [Phycomyces blakesleeanus NRRL 1555(-)]|eukprot:XP_018284231.1 hypothetical protein PHYBLDRAFT_152758 [Phycomyces blakesleeanus NRRL 1555(-)]